MKSADERYIEMVNAMENGGIAGALYDALEIQKEMVISAKSMTHGSQEGLRDLIDNWQYRIAQIRAALESAVK